MQPTLKSVHIFKYVLTFIDNNSKIFDTLEDTFCSDSVLGRIEDNFLNRENNIYMFGICENKCFVKNCTQTKELKLNDEKWIKTIIKDYYINEYFTYSEMYDSFTYFHIYENKSFHVFYIQQINISMCEDSYDKITRSFSDTQQRFNHDELFQIIYSYAFTMFDNRSDIIDRIIISISENLLDISEINDQFIKFMDKQYNLMVTRSIVEKFLDPNCYTEIKKEIEADQNENMKMLLRKLNYWKQALNNFFEILRNHFSIEIMVPHNNWSLKVQNLEKSTFNTKIEYENLEHIIFLLAKKYFFSIKNLDDDLLNCIIYIVNKTEISTITIDITEYFISLYNMNSKLIEYQNKICREFISTIKNSTDKNLILIVGFIEIECKSNVDIIKSTSKIAKNDLYCLFIVSKYIFNTACITKTDLLMKFAVKIIDYFSENYLNSKIKNLDFEKEIDDDFNVNCEFIDNKYTQIHQKLDNSVYDGNAFERRNQFLGIKNSNIVLTNWLKITGVYDGNFSIFELLSNSLLYKKNRFSEYIKSEIEHITKNVYEDFNYFYRIHIRQKECNSSSIKSDYFVFNIAYVNHTDVRIQELNQDNDFSEELKCLSEIKSIYLDSTHILNHSFQLRYKKVVQNQNISSFFDLITQPRLLTNLKIERSRFHIIFLRFMEIKSCRSQMPIFQAKLDHNCYHINIKKCEINFLKKIPCYIMNFSIENSIITTIFQIYTYNLRYSSFEIKSSSFRLRINEWFEIEPFDGSNVRFSFKYHFNSVNLEHYYCKIRILSVINCNLANLFFQNCVITSANRTLVLNNCDIIKGYEYSQIEESVSQSHFNLPKLIIVQSTLPDYFHIKGAFHTVNILYCSSMIEIVNYTKEMFISNHKGVVSYSNLIINAQFLGNDSFIRKNDGLYIFSDLNILELQNINIEILQIKSCFILRIENVSTRNIYIEFLQNNIQIADDTKIEIYKANQMVFITKKNTNCTIKTEHQTSDNGIFNDTSRKNLL